MDLSVIALIGIVMLVITSYSIHYTKLYDEQHLAESGIGVAAGQHGTDHEIAVGLAQGEVAAADRGVERAAVQSYNFV